MKTEIVWVHNWGHPEEAKNCLQGIVDNPDDIVQRPNQCFEVVSSMELAFHNCMKAAGADVEILSVECEES